MAGDTPRREAGPKAQPQTEQRIGSATATGRGPASTKLIVIGLLASALAVVSPPVIGGGVATAEASCRYAHRLPQAMSPGQAQQSVLCLMNRMRHHHGRRGFRAKDSLKESGARHSRYMRRHGCFAHRCRGERDLVGRVKASGYLPCRCTWRVGENIARGEGRRGTPSAIVRAWMHSPSHRAEILSRSLRDVGVGVVWGSKRNRRARVGTFTADFGSKR